MTSKEALDNLKEINRKQNNGNGDIWLESMVIEPIEKDLEILEILKRKLIVEKGGTWWYLDVKHCFFENEEEISLIKEWLDNDK